MNDNEDQGYVPLLPPGQRKQAAPTQTTTPTNAPSGNDQGYVPLAPPGQRQGSGQQTAQASGPPANGDQGWGIDWSTPWSQGGPSLKQPQSMQDFGDIASNEAFMNSLPSLRARAEAARQRLDPAATAAADFVGNVVSPSNLAIPFVGSEGAGALHEGLKSYNNQPNWIPDAQGAKQIGEDTAGGFAAGLGGDLLTRWPEVTRRLYQGGIGVGTGAIAHKLPYTVGQEVMGFLGGAGFSDKFAKGMAYSPEVKQAVKSLLLGVAGTTRNAAGPWDQWIPGQ